VTLSVIGLNTDLARLEVAAQTTGVTLTETRVVLSELRFRMTGSGNGEAGEANFMGPYVADLLLDQTTPTLGTVRIPKGRYSRVELILERLDVEEVPEGISPADPIIGHSFYLGGTRQDGTPFLASLNLSEELFLESTNGFDLGQNGPTHLFLAFDLSSWFAGVDLDSAQVSGATIYIDEANNTELLDLLKENVKDSADLFRDQNGDGNLDSSEEDPEDVLATGT
jgi:hypothetical protein